MDTESRIKKLSFMYLCCFALANAFAFPLTNTSDQIPLDIVELHQNLKSYCDRERVANSNQFACELRFGINQKNTQCQKSMDFLSISINPSPAESTEPFVFTSGVSNNLNFSQLLGLQNAFFNIDNLKIFHLTNAPLALFMANFSTIIKRFNAYPNYNYARQFLIGNIDAETKAIDYLQQDLAIEKIVNQLKLKLKKMVILQKNISIIELHGHSYFDMCPICYANFNMILYLTLNPLTNPLFPLTFFQKLKNKLGDAICDSPSYTIYISSSIEYRNPKFNSPDVQNHVNQFHLPLTTDKNAAAAAAGLVQTPSGTPQSKPATQPTKP